MGAHGKPYDTIKPIRNEPPRYKIVPAWAPRYRGVVGLLVGESVKKLRVQIFVKLPSGTIAERFVTYTKEGKSP